MRKKITCLLLVIGVLLLLLLLNDQAEAGSRFPIYRIIAPNVQFWENIYGTYTGDQGVLHDKDDLSIIYGVIDFVPRNIPGAGKMNAQLEKVVRQRHKKILEKFINGQKPKTKEEKKVYALFKGKQKAAVFREAIENLRIQTGLKNAFREGVIRSGAYIPLIKKIMRAQNLPVELAYLPHVESSFNLQAHSKAAAVGLWQFTKYTGREYMTINELVDERFDVYLSSLAAAKFLKENYRQLESWPLAITAYNYGRTGMVRAQQQWGTYPQIIKNHETGIFKFASKNFYSEFIAAVRVARRLENDRSLIKDRPWINVSFRLKKYASAKKLSEYFGISVEEFRRLNPALRDPIFAGQRYIPQGTLIRLPATKRIRKQIKNIPSRLLYAHQIRDKVYKVRKGDTALGIAIKYKVSLKQLMQANKLDKKAQLRLGQKLKIPSRTVVPKAQAQAKSQPKKKSVDAVVVLQATPKEQAGKTAEGGGKDKETSLQADTKKSSILTLKKVSKKTP
ncbi:MAG: LysM peptidoglycan-binding domain-containing protein [Candidatus Electrothrix sp. AU1_5]|nr:LysM peptidoglycan-binding domain-containing protein [Candidatus Electrothrix sp. AX1]MCI5181908.1 LysM peptidoglycan-binding domain-containing protein [Candidatus Electrothrix gigas]MCI5191680.1 LysM peptidoglycan-binding domain-containing protein [Candidatus Electrothrix gigas]